MPVLRIRLLGGFRVEIDGRPVPDASWRRNRARAVVKALALEPGHRLHREQVIELLWQDLDPTTAGANLRKAVHFARSALGASVLSLRSEILALDAEVETDVAMFEAALAAGRLEGAIDRYAGDLLPEDRFEPWVDDARERLRARFVGALRDLAGRQERSGDTTAAMVTLERLVKVDALDEEAHLRLMAIHASAGARHLALRQFRQLEEALREELDVEPAAATRVMFEAIASGRAFRGGEAVEIPDGPELARRVALSGTAGRDGGSATPEVAFVGRDNERRTILAFADDVAARGAPGLVVISGPAGLGKSRLLREVVRDLGRVAPGTRILQGRCLPGGRAGTFGALGDVLRAASGIALTDRPEQMHRQLHAATATYLARLSDDDQAATVAALALSAGIRLGAGPLDAQKPDEVSRALSVAWPRFASGLAATAPTVLILEDLHWASAELLDMVESIVGRSTGPLLVLATARPDLHDIDPGFGASVDVTTIALRPLSDAESGDLVASLAGPGPLDIGSRARILDRAEGNPLYLEQLTAHFRETGSEGLPETLQSLLGARLDALGPADRRLLQEAAVIGRSFWVAPLEAALPGERVAARLALLERKRFLVRRPDSSLPGHDEFAFRHALLHDVAYRSLPRERRAHAHARAGTWLEAIVGDRADEVADLLAHHFEAAVGSARPGSEPDAEQRRVRGKAIDYLVRAGDAARRRFALERALDLHRRAGAIAIDDRDRIRVLEAVAEDHDAGFHGDAAEAA
jgi:DNA-binding SARP family transcriptional activator